MKSILHRPEVIQRLRPLRPLYNMLFDRRPRFSSADAPAARLASLGGKGIFLFSFGRSGTTVFCDFLASHPDIITLGEVLTEDAFRNLFGTLKRHAHRHRPSAVEKLFYRFVARRVQAAGGKHVLFDMKFESLHTIEGNFRLPGHDFKIFDALIGSGNPVILLERRDMVARYISHEVAVHRDVYHSFQAAEAEVAPITIDVARMDREIALARDQISFVKAKLSDHDRFIELAYEDLFVPAEEGGTRFNPEVVARLAGLIGVPDRFDPVPRLERVSRGRTMDYITNADEVRAYRDRV